jgi:Outer membrane protein beta-barrel domain
MKVKFRTIFLIIFGLLFFNLTVFTQEVNEKTEQVDSNTSKKQDSEKLKKFEIGGQFTFVKLGNFSIVNRFLEKEGRKLDKSINKSQNEPGFGLRFSYNINKNIAIDTEANLLPRFTNLNVPDNFFEKGGIKAQFLLGVKIGKRLRIKDKKVGVFGKVRPGFIRFDRFQRITDVLRFPGGFFLEAVPRRAAFFNLDVGGVVEYYPTKRTIVRVDFGDTIIHYGKPGDPRFKPLNPTFTTHNFQTSIGFSLRF